MIYTDELRFDKEALMEVMEFLAGYIIRKNEFEREMIKIDVFKRYKNAQ